MVKVGGKSSLIVYFGSHKFFEIQHDVLFRH